MSTSLPTPEEFKARHMVAGEWKHPSDAIAYGVIVKQWKKINEKKNAFDKNEELKRRKTEWLK